MSGTAPNDPAPGGHPNDRGIEQTPLDSHQHGQAQNIIDETKDTYGRSVDPNVGETIDAVRRASAGDESDLSSRVDDLLNQPPGSGKDAEVEKAAKKGEATRIKGFKVGAEAGQDMHELAGRKQP